MASFGKYLRDHKVLTSSELDEATHSMVVYGGRLGTHLVELGYLPLAEVEKHLSAFLRVPTPPVAWLEKPDPEALKALPLSLVRKHRVLPLRLESERRTLHVALLDPRDPRVMDEIAFAAGLRIQPYVILETRMAQLLERHFRIARDARFAWLARRARSHEPSPLASGDVPSVPLPPPTREEIEEAEREREALGLRALGAHEELIDDDTFATLHESWQQSASSGVFQDGALPGSAGAAGGAAQGAARPAAAAPLPAARVPAAAPPAPVAAPPAESPAANLVAAPHVQPVAMPAAARPIAAAPPPLAPGANAAPAALPPAPAPIPAAPAPATPGASAAPAALPAAPVPAAPRAAARGDDDTHVSPASAVPAQTPASAITPLPALERALTEASDREEVTRLALQVARHFTANAALFVVGQGMIQGVRAVLGGAEREIPGILVPRQGESIFSVPATRGERFHGAPAKGGLDEMLLRALQRSDARDVAVLPIRIRDRIVNLLYADNGADAIGATSLLALVALCDLVAQSYERIILARKNRHC